MDVCDVVEVNDGAVGLLHRQVIETVEKDRARVQRDVPVELSNFRVAGRQNEILRGNRVDNVVGRNVVRLHGLLVEIHLGLKNLPAVRRWHRRAGHRGELRTDEILPEIEKLHLRQLFSGQRQLQDRDGSGVVAEHVGRRDARRQQLQHGLRRRSYLGERRADVGVSSERRF